MPTHYRREEMVAFLNMTAPSKNWRQRPCKGAVQDLVCRAPTRARNDGKIRVKEPRRAAGKE